MARPTSRCSIRAVNFHSPLHPLWEADRYSHLLTISLRQTVPPIHILGTVELPVNIGGHDSVIKMLVTPDVREPMLSFAWLKENHVCWDFTRNALYVHGR